jgi:hypothetical protein
VHAWLSQGGGLEDLNGLLPAGSGWVLTTAVGINERTQIAGNGQHGAQPRGFLLAAPRVSPVTAASLAPAPNAAGWSNADVVVTLSAAQEPGGPGVQQLTYGATGAQPIATATVSGAEARITLSAEGTTTLTFYATDRAGTQEAPQSLVVRIDKTPPTVAYGGNASPYTVDQDVRVTCAATDALSGVVSTTCADAAGPAWSFAPETTLSATATDRAGNVGRGSTTIRVQATYAGLCALARRFSADAALAEGMCRVLDVGATADGLGSASGKATALAGFGRVVAGAQAAKALTAQEAAVLTTWAARL